MKQELKPPMDSMDEDTRRVSLPIFCANGEHGRGSQGESAWKAVPVLAGTTLADEIATCRQHVFYRRPSAFIGGSRLYVPTYEAKHDLQNHLQS